MYRNAKLSLAEMRQLADRILADQGYWQGQGIEIQAVAPRVDGEDVTVTLSRDDITKGEQELKKRYDADRITV